MQTADETPAAYDEVADAYSRTFDPDGSGLDDPVLAELLGDVAGRHVLSLACGQGQDARLVAVLGASVTGVDLSEGMLGYARRHEAARPRGITYVRDDAETLAQLEADSFDGVVCHMALMDIPRLEPAVAAVARVLRGGGWFVFSITHPCFAGHVAVASDYLADHRYEKRLAHTFLPPHAYHRPLGTYVNELTRAGFRVVRMREAHHPASDQSGVPALLYARAVLD